MAIGESETVMDLKRETKPFLCMWQAIPGKRQRQIGFSSFPGMNGFLKLQSIREIPCQVSSDGFDITSFNIDF